MHEALIRVATKDDIDAVRDVLQAAFGREDEAVLVARLRREGAVLLELLAERDGAPVGHVLFSDAPISEDTHRVAAAALAPLAVVPERQGQGIGAALVTAGLALCRARGVAAVLVLGDPGYYGRFGFSAAAAAGLRAPFQGAAFQALALVPGALDRGGAVRYADAFMT